MSIWFWNMYHCCRGIGFSYRKSLRMAWSARHGPDPKMIESARKALHSLREDSRKDTQ